MTVYAVDAQSKIESRTVTLGIQTDTDAEIISGLSEGDTIVASDRSGLKAGKRCSPQPMNLDQRERQRECAAGQLKPSHAWILDSQSLFHHRPLPRAGGHRRDQPGADAGRSVSHHQSCREVVVATFYSGMPPQDIEADITNPLERFFTLASGIDHMESRSMLGVSIIKVYFQPGTNADADVTELSNLALADLKRLPPGTLPPVVLKFDASSLPVCLVTLKGRRFDADAAARHRPVHYPQPDCRGERRRNPSAVRRQIPPGDGVRRSVQAALAAAEPDGRR